jgi:hypothetical protein
MALKNLPYKRLQHLIGVHLSTKESASTQQAIDELSHSKLRGYLTKAELVKVCRWKSARAIRQIQRNRAERIKKVTGEAFATRSERKKLTLLTSLHGVSVPMASAILMLTRPTRYGVIDIRVWQLLYKMGSVTSNENGLHFAFKEWYRYLMILRYYAKKYNVGARDIERTLFLAHGRYQKGTLYK